MLLNTTRKVPSPSRCPGVSPMLPHINKFIPTSASHEALNKHAHIHPDRELRVVIIPTHQSILHHEIPNTHRHIIGARHHQIPHVWREFHLPNSIPVPIEHTKGNPIVPHVPNLNALIDGGSGNDTLVVLVPVAGEDLELVGGEDHGGAGLADVPDAEGAVAGGGGEDVGVAGVPDGGVDAVGVLLEGADAGGAVEGPELDGVVPGGGEEGVTADGVVVGGVDLAGVFLEGADGVGGWGEGQVVELNGAVGDGGDDDGVVGFGPGHVVDAVGGVVGDQLRDGEGRLRGEVEDVEAAVAQDAEVLGGGHGQAVLVEGAELYGVAVERGFENRHRFVFKGGIN